MVYKMLFVTVLGLCCIYIDGKSLDRSIESTAERPEVCDIFDAGSTTNLKPRRKRDLTESEPSDGKAKAESLGYWVNEIERYIPVIREGIERIQKKFGDRVSNFENPPDENFDNSVSETRTIPTFAERDDFMFKLRDRHLFPDNDDDDKIIDEKDGGDDEPVKTDMNETSNGDDREKETDERVESVRGFKGHVPPNFVHSNNVPSRRDFEVKGSRQHGIGTHCNECGQPMHCCESVIPVKPLVINIQSDCSTHPKAAFMERHAIESKPHFRMLNHGSHQIPKSNAFHIRALPHCCCR